MILLEPRTLHQSAKLKNVPKNDYGFTLFKFFVNQNCAFLSIAKSIECSWFTAPCRILVQSPHRNLTNPHCFRAFPRMQEIQGRFSRHTHAIPAVWKSRHNAEIMRSFENAVSGRKRVRNLVHCHLERVKRMLNESKDPLVDRTTHGLKRFRSRKHARLPYTSLKSAQRQGRN